MWILSCDTDLLGGKCIWLRPGSQHLLGRTTGRSAGEQLQYIDHKSISRKHLMIVVEPLATGSSRHIHTRSKITLEDSSKSGTFVNGDRLTKEKREVDKTETKIQLGSSNYVFRITWRPVVLTFTNLTSSQKKLPDPLQEYRDALEHADIKLLTSYVSGMTTHVVATGRNNPACLQALAQARWTVQYSWVSTLAEIVKIESIDVTKTPLESDFVAEWPSETRALIPSGTEPTPRPDDVLMPDKRRSEAFSGLTVVFQTEKQHDTLMPAVNAAGGKTLFLPVVANETNVDEYVESVLAHFRTDKSGAIKAEDTQRMAVVRAEPKDNLDWWETFTEDLQSTIGRRCIAQGEFLDAILMMDTSSLRDPVPITRSIVSAARQTSDDPQSIQSNGTQRLGKARRYAAQSRFKGFDDFDPSQVIRIPSQSPEPLQQSQQPDEDAMDIGNVKEDSKPRKRPAPVPDIDEVLERQLGPLNAAKRQCLERAAENAAPEVDNPQPPTVRTAKSRLPDVKAKLAEQRKKEEEERLRQEEHLDHQLEGLTVDDLQKLVQHEEFSVTLPEVASASPHSAEERPGWDPAWNNRKNFKAFRAKGQAHTGRGPQHQRVMVDLEELPRKTDAFFDEYYLDRSSNQRTREMGSLAASNDQPPSLGMSSYSASGDPHTAPAPDRQLAGQKRPRPEQTTAAATSKRPRRQQRVNLDEDSDDELQFRRKRL